VGKINDQQLFNGAVVQALGDLYLAVMPRTGESEKSAADYHAEQFKVTLREIQAFVYPEGESTAVPE